LSSLLSSSSSSLFQRELIWQGNCSLPFSPTGAIPRTSTLVSGRASSPPCALPPNGPALIQESPRRPGLPSWYRRAPPGAPAGGAPAKGLVPSSAPFRATITGRDGRRSGSGGQITSARPVRSDRRMGMWKDDKGGGYFFISPRRCKKKEEEKKKRGKRKIFDMARCSRDLSALTTKS